MNRKYLSVIIAFSVFFILNFISIPKVFSCQCSIPSVCRAYSKAKKVFIGKLEKIVEDKTTNLYTVDAHFSVEKVYKGKTEKTEIVKFKLGTCAERDFAVGEKYFVYAEEGNVNTYCNPTAPISWAAREIEYAESLSEKNPSFSVFGLMLRSSNISDEEFRKIEVKIEDGRKNHKIIVDKNGMFSFKSLRKASYKVKILLPFRADIEITDGNQVLSDAKILSTKSGTTSISYELKFKPNECDTREIGISKKQ